MDKKLVLASNSPRRKELLEKFGFNFEIKVSDYKEDNSLSDPVLTAKTFAEGKAKSVFAIQKEKDVIVLGADTVVYSEGKILGKAKSKEQAFDMLKSLSGKSHLVITGYCILGGEKPIIDCVQSIVTFNYLTDEQIYKYIESGLYKGKAGSYGIQDGFGLVKSCEGSVNNVIGLPIEIIAPKLKAALK